MNVNLLRFRQNSFKQVQYMKQVLLTIVNSTASLKSFKYLQRTESQDLTVCPKLTFRADNVGSIEQLLHIFSTFTATQLQATDYATVAPFINVISLFS